MIKFVDKFKMYGEDELSFASINQAKEMNKTPQERYDKENTMRVSLKLNKKYDADILEYLDKSGNKQGAIKDALREKMTKKQLRRLA